MKTLIHPLCVFMLLFGMINGVLAQAQISSATSEKVTLIGEYEETFKKLSVSHQDLLLSVCGNDMDFAYDKWMRMLGEMEDYAEGIGYDIKGLKTYLYVYWNADGTIAHLSFFPKTKSRNIPLNELRAFFSSFVETYQMQINAEKGFSHYGSAAFPTVSRPALRAKRND